MKAHTKRIATVIWVALILSMVWMPAATFAQNNPTPESPLPTPTGPYQVGRTSRHWVDETRDEPFTDDPNDHRELMIRIWYPADVEESATPGLYFPEVETLISAYEEATVPEASMASLLVALFRMSTHSVDGAPVSSQQTHYPVLVFSPGYGAIPEWYTVQMEELASHGYIVAGITHPYHSFATVFPDGRVVTLGVQSVMGGLDDLTRDQLTGVAAEDMVFVVDQLVALNADDPEGLFTDRLDLDHIGGFGMSLGGTAAMVAGAADDRLKAVINEDGGRGTESELLQPFLFLTARTCSITTAGPNHCVFSIDFRHLDFTDWPVFPVVAAFMPGDLIGPMDGVRTVEIVRAYVLAFFDRYLKGEDSGLLDGPSDDYPEVGVWSRNTE